MRFEVDTKATPQQVLRAFTDFTDRRPEIWEGTLDPKRYELREQGQTWAVTRESSPGSPVWLVVRYDWSDPSVVRWTVLESSYGGGGDGSVRITPGPGSGSHLDAEWDSTGARLLHRPLLVVIHRSPLWRMIRRRWTGILDRYAERDPDSTAA
ncbi:hypothetical protein [Terrabacter sp. 2RAF25]|uniref:hypothetical protein n=1 Tax=Terrabacter sp. 2RAF25 TaxID=3232998 RepID=UPI003F948A22